MYNSKVMCFMSGENGKKIYYQNKKKQYFLPNIYETL